MALLDAIEVRTPLDVRFIELHQGDILDIDRSQPNDFLVVSAFPGDYLPTPTSLIGQLGLRGISVEDLARRRAADLTRECACWMSEELSQTAIPYRRILCFEPRSRGAPPDVVGDIFRAIIPFLGDPARSYTAAMPLVATGDQRTPIDHMLAPLLDAAMLWMSHGIALERLMIFVRSDESAALAQDIFGQRRRLATSSTQRIAAEFDVFVSYAHEQEAEMKLLAATLGDHAPEARLFVDKIELKPGTAWEPALIDAIDASRLVVPLYSDHYVRSRVCNDEFNAAFGRWRSNQVQLFPLKVYEAKLLPHMKKVHYEDCREGDSSKIAKSAVDIAKVLRDLGPTP